MYTIERLAYEEATLNISEIIDTPAKVLELLMKEDGCFYAKDIDDAVAAYCKRKRLDFSGKSVILYAPDVDLNPKKLLFKRRLIRDAETLQVFTDILSKVRKEVARSLEKRGAEVVRIIQTSAAVNAPSLRSTQWGAALENNFDDASLLRSMKWGVVTLPAPCEVYKISERNAEPSLDTYPIFKHPNLADEVVVDHKHHVISKATNHTGVPNFHAVMRKTSLSECLSIVKDAMTGNDHMHQMGFGHGDIKPANVLVFTKEAKKVGVLTDFESVQRLGLGPPLALTPDYAEDDYYCRWRTYEEYLNGLGEKHYLPLDAKKDLFSWGMVLLGLFAPLTQLDKVRARCGKCSTPKKQEKVLFDLVDQVVPQDLPEEFVDLIKSMLQADRDGRPDFSCVINTLQGYMAEPYFARPTPVSLYEPFKTRFMKKIVGLIPWLKKQDLPVTETEVLAA